MKFLIPIFSLLLFFSCKEPNTTFNNKEVTLKLSKKELSKLFEGQELYSIKGVKSKFENKNVRIKSILSKKEYILHIDFNNQYYEGSKEILLHSNTRYFEIYKSLKWYIEENKLIWPKTDLLAVNFNQGVRKNFVLFSIPNKESIEYGEKRFVQKLSYLSSKKIFDIEKSETPKVVDYNNCYDYDYKSLVLLYVYLKEAKITLKSCTAIKLIPNPLTNSIEFLLDFSEISVDKKGIDFEDYKKEIGEIKEINSIKFNNTLNKFISERELVNKGVEKNNHFKKKKGFLKEN